MSGGDVMGGQLGLGWLRSHERLEDYGSILRTFAAGPVIDPPSIIDHRKWLEAKQRLIGETTTFHRLLIMPTR